MKIFIYLLIFVLYSCKYPDIDTVPKFNLQRTFFEKCNLIYSNENPTITECEIIKIINRL